MATLWTTGDNQSQERRNREAIIGRLGVPLYDVDNLSAITLVQRVALAQLQTAIGDIWAVPSGIAAALVTTIKITNTDSVARTPLIYFIEPGQTAASVARSIWLDELQAGETVSIRMPFILAASAVIRGLCAAAADVISVRVDAITFADQPAGMTLKVVEGIAMTNALATVYTCPGQQAILLSLVMCNTDASARTPEVHVVPSAGAAAVSNQIWKNQLNAKESVFIDDYHILGSGDFIRQKASVTAVVSARYSILEVD